MSRVAVGRDDNGTEVALAYHDHGDGRPVVLVPGLPLGRDSWEHQARALREAGHRVVTFDRRGYGESSRPAGGYDFDTFAADLNCLLEHLDLRDVVLAGFSTGTGEVARYLGTFGSARIGKAVLVAAVPPGLRAAERGAAEAAQAEAGGDWHTHLRAFLDEAFDARRLGPDRAGDAKIEEAFLGAATAAPQAIADAVALCLTDFRADLAKIDVPTLVLHGTEDRILPFAATAGRLPGLIRDVRLVPVAGGPHHVAWTFPEVVTPALVDFAHPARW
jgi:non-heme chloroperoxidase